MKITELKRMIREIIKEETEYQTFFKKALEKTGKSIPQMSDEEKKDFFNKIDKAWKGKGEKSESVNEAIGSLTILGTGVLAVFALLQMFIAYKRNYQPALTLKGADSIYSNLLKFWKPTHFVNTWKIVKRDTKILKIVNRLKDDPEVKKFLENPKQTGWYKMLSKKLDASEMDMLKKIYKRHFDKDGPNMDGSKWSHLESKYIKHKMKFNESVNEAKFDASAYKPAPEWKNKMQQRSEFGNLLSPNDVKFLVNSQTKTFTKGNNLIVTDGNRWMVFNTSSPVSKVKRLGNAPQSIKDLHSNS